MPAWTGYLIAFAALVLIAPFAARLGRWQGRQQGKARRGLKGNLALASLLLGFGAVMDPPQRHAIEARQREEEPDPGAGDPPTT